MSFIDNLNNLDTSNPGVWPLPVKFMMFVLAFVAVLGIGWYIDVSGQQDEIEHLAMEATKQLDMLEKKQYQAANLDALKEQMVEIQKSFGDMLRQLPNKTEVPGLLVDISQIGLSAGLEFKLFKPMEEQEADFYATLPIQIDVVGGYHDLGKFVSDIAALPRIVTIHDVKITKLGNPNENNNLLRMTAVANTYRALEVGE